MNRIATLLSLLEQDPGNSRLRYMLAMESLNAGDPAGAVAVFEEVVSRDADYCPAYFHAGQTLEKLGRVEEAKRMYRNGIEAASRTGDGHTRSELQSALDVLGG